MLPNFTVRQLRILLFALDNLQGEIAADLNGWTIGPSQEGDIDFFCENIELDVEIDLLRSAVERSIQ